MGGTGRVTCGVWVGARYSIKLVVWVGGTGRVTCGVWVGARYSIKFGLWVRGRDSVTYGVMISSCGWFWFVLIVNTLIALLKNNTQKIEIVFNNLYFIIRSGFEFNAKKLFLFSKLKNFRLF